jgi:hypothetical protein
MAYQVGDILVHPEGDVMYIMKSVDEVNGYYKICSIRKGRKDCEYYYGKSALDKLQGPNFDYKYYPVVK